MTFEGEHKLIPISGISRAGADTVCEDGSMNEVVGLELKDGSYVPYESDETSALLPDLVDKFYTHKTSHGDNAIILTEGNVYYMKMKDFLDGKGGEWKDDYNNSIWTLLHTSSEQETYAKDIEFLGNSVTVMMTKGTRFYVYNGTEYIDQTSIPTDYNNYLLRFRVTRGIAGHDDIEGSAPISVQSLKCEHYSDTTGYGSAMKNRFEEFVSVVNNKGEGSSLLTKAQGLLTEKGGLYGYFLVCFAYRLKNGDLRYASAPILMCPPCIKQKGIYVSDNNDASSESFDLCKIWDNTGNSEDAGKFVYYQYDKLETNNANVAAQLVRIDEENVIHGLFKETSYESVSSTPYQYLLKTEYDKDATYENVIQKGGANAGKRRYFYSFLRTIDSKDYKLVQPIPMSSSISLWIKNGESGDDASKQDKAYKTVTTHALSNKLQFGISSALIENMPDDVSSICVFMTEQVSPFSNTVEDAYVDVHGPFLDGNSLSAKGTLSSNFKMMYTYTPQYRSDKLVADDIKKLKSFYLVKEIYKDELKDMDAEQWQDVDLRGLLGDTLLTRESLPLSAFDYTTFSANVMKSYNYRMHLGDITTKLSKGYDWLSLINDWNSGRGQWYNGNWFDSNTFVANVGEEKTGLVQVVYLRNEDNSESVVVSRINEDRKRFNCVNSFIVYPDVRAYKMDIFRRVGTSWRLMKSCGLVPNKYLGFSYYLDSSLKETELTEELNTNIDIASLESNVEHKDENTMRVSDTAFPSIFPHANTDRVGSGKILGFARLTIAMSQDMYGQHPLLVFTTEGIYSLGVDTTGAKAYSTHPMFSNEVCTNPNSICELSSAVLFASEKGLMVATQDGVDFFAPLLNGDVKHRPQTGDRYGVGLSWYYKMVNDREKMTNLLGSLSTTDFRKYLQDENTHVVYVANKNKVLIYNSYESYCYWMDIPTRLTTTMPIKILMHNNEYPDTLFYNGDSKVIKFSVSPDVFGTDTLMQTRPIVLSQNLKGSLRVVLRGKFTTEERGKYAILLVLGSIDGEHWLPIGLKEKSLDGEFHDIGCVTDRVSVNYMMVIFAANLGGDSHIDSLELTMKNKYNNKLR